MLREIVYLRHAHLRWMIEAAVIFFIIMEGWAIFLSLNDGEPFMSSLLQGFDVWLFFIIGFAELAIITLTLRAVLWIVPQHIFKKIAI